ncbi:MAG: hypothetical protein K2L23_05535 [Odoribacter sp.]|nr:hypothetical protein [Odoribacter sp.]
MDSEVILVGGFHEIIELCESTGKHIIGIIDGRLKGNFMNYPILGEDKDAVELFEKFKNIPLIITPDSPQVRCQLFEYYASIGFSFTSVISPLAHISAHAVLGKGIVIQAGVSVSSFACIGDFVKLNVNSNVMHDSIVGNFSTVAPEAVVLGRVQIGKGVYIGANATVLPELQIIDHITIGAGAVVTHSLLENGKVYAGVPARILEKR